MTFGDAIERVKHGQCLTRHGWNGSNMWIALVGASPGFDRHSKSPCWGYEQLPWIGMRTADKKFVPWVAAQTDMLAEDWAICSVEVNENEKSD